MDSVITHRAKPDKYWAKACANEEFVATVYLREKGANGGMSLKPDGPRYKLRRDKDVSGWKVFVKEDCDDVAVLRMKPSRQGFLVRMDDRLFVLRRREACGGRVWLKVWEREEVEEQEQEEVDADEAECEQEEEEEEEEDEEQEEQNAKGEEDDEQEQVEEEGLPDDIDDDDEGDEEEDEDEGDENVKAKHRIGKVVAHSDCNATFSTVITEDTPELFPHIATWLAFFVTRRQNNE